MFKKNNDVLVFENEGIEYNLWDDLDSYKKLIIYLTNPTKKITLNFDMDASLSEEEVMICQNYKVFLEEFIKQKNEKMIVSKENQSDNEGVAEEN